MTRSQCHLHSSVSIPIHKQLRNWPQIIDIVIISSTVLVVFQGTKSISFLFLPPYFATLQTSEGLTLRDFCIVNLSVYKLPHYVNAECFKTQIYAQRAWIFEVFQYDREIILLSSCGRYRSARGYMTISSVLCRWWPMNIQGGKIIFYHYCVLCRSRWRIKHAWVARSSENNYTHLPEM